MAGVQTKPDGIKVRLLENCDYGTKGDVIILSTPVAEEQIAKGSAEEFIDVPADPKPVDE